MDIIYHTIIYQTANWTSHGRMLTQIMLSHLTEYYVALKAVSLKLFNSVGKCFQKF